MKLENLNLVTDTERRMLLLKCCGSLLWVDEMMKQFPFNSEAELFEKAANIWCEQCGETDWLEAFTHHPKIGDLKSLDGKFASTKALAAGEQGGVQKANANTIAELAQLNSAYEKKFGFIFIVCASGKSAEEMLLLLKNRLPNRKEKELKIAMEEQAKITTLRMQKLL